MGGPWSGVHRAEQCLKIDAAAHRAFAEGDVDNAAALAGLRGGHSLGEVLGRLVATLIGEENGFIVPVIANGKLTHSLPAETAVEVSTFGLANLQWDGSDRSALPRPVMGIVQQIAEYECLAVEAAVTGSALDMIAAAATHPLIAGWANPVRVVNDYLRS